MSKKFSKDDELSELGKLRREFLKGTASSLSFMHLLFLDDVFGFQDKPAGSGEGNNKSNTSENGNSKSTEDNQSNFSAGRSSSDAPRSETDRGLAMRGGEGGSVVFKDRVETKRTSDSLENELDDLTKTFFKTEIENDKAIKNSKKKLLGLKQAKKYNKKLHKKIRKPIWIAPAPPVQKAITLAVIKGNEELVDWAIDKGIDKQKKEIESAERESKKNNFEFDKELENIVNKSDDKNLRDKIVDFLIEERGINQSINSSNIYRDFMQNTDLSRQAKRNRNSSSLF